MKNIVFVLFVVCFTLFACDDKKEEKCHDVEAQDADVVSTEDTTVEEDAPQVEDVEATEDTTEEEDVAQVEEDTQTVEDILEDSFVSLPEDASQS